MFKYALKQTIFYLQDNVVKSAAILSRRFVENSDNQADLTDGQRKVYQIWGRNAIEYKTIHGIIEESKAFASKEELLKSL